MKVLIAANSGENFEGGIAYLKENSWPPQSLFRLLHIVEPSEVTDLCLSMSGATRFRHILSERQLEAESQSNLTVAKCMQVLGAKAKLDSSILVGFIDEVVIRSAHDWKADLLIVCLAEATFFGRCTEGALLSRVSADAPCPVLFARKQKDLRSRKSA